MFARSFPVLPLLSDSWRRSPLHIVQSSNSTHQVLVLDILPRGDSYAPSYCFYIPATEMQKVADAADISVLFFQLVLIFGPFWVIFGPFWQFWVIFGPIWAILGHFWAILGNFR